MRAVLQVLLSMLFIVLILASSSAHAEKIGIFYLA